MTDQRVLSAEAATLEAMARRTADVVGDGSTLDAATFAGLGVAERVHLFATNPQRYRELQAELDRATDLARMAGGR